MNPVEPENALSTASRATSRDSSVLDALLDALIVLAKHKILIGSVVLLAGVAATAAALLTPNIYTGSTKILPPQQGQGSASAMLGQLGVLAAGVGTAALGVKNPGDLYVGMLKSRTIADALVQRFDLRKLYDQKTLTGARTELKNRTAIVAAKDGIITIDVEDESPQRAAAIANAYVSELYKLTQTLAVTEASQRRLFFERQLSQAKENLANAEVALKRTQEATGLIRLDDQGRAIIENIARMRAQVSAKEVQLSALKTFATADNPQYMRIQQELAELRAQLARAEKDPGGDQGEIFVPTRRIAQSGLEYVRRLRDVKYHETVYELLARQFELAKVDEAKEGSLVQVLDPAVVPERKTKPRRAQTIILSVVLAGVAAALISFVREGLANARANPERSRRLSLFREYLGRRRARRESSNSAQSASRAVDRAR